MLHIVYDNLPEYAVIGYDIGLEHDHHQCYWNLGEWTSIAPFVNRGGRLRLPTFSRSEPDELIGIYQEAVAPLDRTPDRSLIVATRHVETGPEAGYEIGFLLLPSFVGGLGGVTRPPEWLPVGPEAQPEAAGEPQSILIPASEVRPGDRYPTVHGVTRTVVSIGHNEGEVILFFSDGASYRCDATRRVEVIRDALVVGNVTNWTPTPVAEIRTFRPIAREVRALVVERAGIHEVGGIIPQYLSQGVYVVEDDATLRALTSEEARHFHDHFEEVPRMPEGSTPWWRHLRAE